MKVLGGKEFVRFGLIKWYIFRLFTVVKLRLLSYVVFLRVSDPAGLL